jgi:sortase A
VVVDHSTVGLRTRIAAASGAVLAVATGVVAGLAFAGGGHSEPAVVARGDNPVAVVSSTLPPPTSPPDAPPLPVPAPVPADPYERVPIVPIGEIAIPRIGLVHTMYEGVSLTVIDRGPGHWPGTAMPGGFGNVVIAGHRTTNSRPFRNIDQLEVGDEIILRTDAGTFVYRVSETRVVEEHEMWIVDQRPGYTVTLFACHPPGSAQYRYVVFGELAPS